MGNNNIYCAMIRTPDCDGYNANDPTTFDLLTVSSSHELCEVIINPVVGNWCHWFHDDKFKERSWVFVTRPGNRLRPENYIECLQFKALLNCLLLAFTPLDQERNTSWL